MSNANSVNFNTPFNRTVAENLDQLAIELVNYFTLNLVARGDFDFTLMRSTWENLDEIRDCLIPVFFNVSNDIITLEGLAARKGVNLDAFVQQLRAYLNKDNGPIGLFILYLMEPYIAYKRHNINSYPASFNDAQHYGHFLDTILRPLEVFRANPMDLCHHHTYPGLMDNLVRLMSNFTIIQLPSVRGGGINDL
jgi:hypothetical protein